MQQGKIERIPQTVAGVAGAVSLAAKCVHTDFHNKDDKFTQIVLDCSIQAAWATGVVAIHFKRDGLKEAVAVRIDELTYVLHEAAEAALQAKAAKEAANAENPD